MPSPKRAGHTTVLVQIADEVHGTADARRRSEQLTWSKLISTLLSRWSAGTDGAALTKPVRVGRPATPEAAEMQRLVDEWTKDPVYATACTEKVDISNLKRYRSLGELLAAGAARAAPVLPPAVVAKLDEDDDEVGDV